MLTALKEKILHLQNSPEPVRRRWAIGASAFLMIAVVLLWVGYMRLTISPVSVDNISPPEIPADTSSPATQSALRPVGQWATALARDAGRGLLSLFRHLTAPRQFDITH